MSQTYDWSMAVFFTPTVASAAEASTQDVVSKSDTILQAVSVVRCAGYREPPKLDSQLTGKFTKRL